MLTNQFINQVPATGQVGFFGSHQMVVRKLLLQETGTYNAMYNRPYEVNSQGGMMEAAIARLDRANGQLSGGGLAGIGSLLLRPVASVAQGRSDIFIPNGWDNRRLRFVLEVEVTAKTGSTSIYYFQGFSEYVGTSLQGSIDPRMRFYVNSFIRVGRFQVATPTGMAFRDVVQESAQVLNGQLLYQGQSPVYKLRPCDVFSGIQSNHLNSATYGDVFDTRTIVDRGTSSFGNTRANNTPTNYLATFMQGYKDALNLANFGTGDGGIMSRAQCTTMSSEAAPEENPVLRAMANLQGIPQTVEFSMNDLMMLDPAVGTKTTYHALQGAGLGLLHSTGQTEFWTSATMETQFAVQLANTVPALMMESFICEMGFKATNMFGMGQSQCLPLYAKALTGADMTPQIDALMRRIQHEVMFDLSFGNQVIYDVEMQVDTIGETRISVSIDGKPAVPYAVPSFGDGLLAPVYTRMENQFAGLTNDMEIITNYIKEATVPSASINTNI